MDYDKIYIEERVEVRRWGGVSKRKRVLIENDMPRDDDDDAVGEKI